ncbi:hypothetical protein K439DRAFT_907236 [Ramaria rubella]|nr:hypothetical protein K439DRAFT_907236 [Ramaria rubella]
MRLGIHHDPRLDELITTLPKLTEDDVDLDGVCPICLVQFRAHLAEEEMALAMDSPAHASEDLGVTRLENTCRHIFCRKDISTWIRQSRNSCPTCRRPLLDPPIIADASEQPSAETLSPGDQQATIQMTDEMIREVLEALGSMDGPPNLGQAESMHRLVESLLPSIPQLETQIPNDGHDYPDRSEFGMYS